jgi:hypothetical protein
MYGWEGMPVDCPNANAGLKATHRPAKNSFDGERGLILIYALLVELRASPVNVDRMAEVLPAAV